MYLDIFNIVFFIVFWSLFCNFPFLQTIQTLQFIYTTRQYTHYIGIVQPVYIYSCIELIPISKVITYEMIMITASR